jgi:hypothetical protein
MPLNVTFHNLYNAITVYIAFTVIAIAITALVSWMVLITLVGYSIYTNCQVILEVRETNIRNEQIKQQVLLVRSLAETIAQSHIVFSSIRRMTRAVTRAVITTAMAMNAM